jgi:hypothetical protein
MIWLPIGFTFERIICDKGSHKSINTTGVTGELCWNFSIIILRIVIVFGVSSSNLTS